MFGLYLYMLCWMPMHPIKLNIIKISLPLNEYANTTLNHRFSIVSPDLWILSSRFMVERQKMNIFSPVIFVLMFQLSPAEILHKRNRRYLLYSLQGSKLQLIFGTGVPIHVKDISATIGWVIKSAYLLPTNSSIYTDPYGDIRSKRTIKKRNIHRNDLYENFEKKILSFHSGGRDCLLKAICEASQIPFQKAGLVGQLLSIFFLPSSTKEMVDKEGDDSYLKAERRGMEKSQSCNDHYPNCELNLFDIFSIVK